MVYSPMISLVVFLMTRAGAVDEQDDALSVVCAADAVAA